MAEAIISPAPSDSEVPLDQGKLIEHKRKIRDLEKQLRVIMNVCASTVEYMKFQEHVSPNLRVLLDLNQLMLLIFTMKGATKAVVEYDFIIIDNPPDALGASMRNTFDNLDAVTTVFSNSIKDIINALHLDPVQHSKSTST